MLAYSKPFLHLSAQVALLQARGLKVTDVATAEKCLRRIGYYRLSAYWYPFRVLTNSQPPVRSDNFLDGSRFQDAVSLYVFDKKLKMLALDAIERVEIAVRVGIALLLGARNPFAYTDTLSFRPEFQSRILRSGSTAFLEWTNRMNDMVNRSSEDFILHYRAKYRMPLPIWIAIEVWGFGMLSKFFSGLLDSDRTAIARKFHISNAIILESWLRALNLCRNIIARHGRLWNRSLVDYPVLPYQGRMPDFDALHAHSNINKRLYFVLCILAHFLSVINPSSDWKSRVVALADGFPTMPHAKLNDIGFPANWKTHAFWN